MRLTTCGIVFMALTSGAIAQTALSEEELGQTFTGKKVEWVNVGVTEYKLDGSFEFYSFERKQTLQGKIKFSAGTICYVITPTREFCDKVSRDAKGIYLTSPRGNVAYARFQ